MPRMKLLGRVAAALVLAGVVAAGLSGCVLVPAPVPVAGPVVVAPRPVVVAPAPVYGYYGYYGHGYGWRRW